MLRMKKYNDGVRVYGYFNMNDYVLITKNGSRAIISSPIGNLEDELDGLVGEIYDHFNANSYQELVNKCQEIVKFVLGNQTKIENLSEILNELNESGESSIELDIDSELDTPDHVLTLENEIKKSVNFEIEFKLFEFKSNKGYIKSRELFIKKVA